MAERKKLVEIDIPPTSGADWDEVHDVNNVRRYIHRQGATLPGDIELEVRAYGDADLTGYWVTVWEQPNMPETV